MSAIDLSPLKEYAAMLIAQIIDRKIRDNVLPQNADMIEIQNRTIADLKIVLNQLCGEHAIKFQRTLNSVAFEFTPPKK